MLRCAGAPICINTVLWNTIKLLFPKHAANAPESPADAILTPSSANNAALVANAVAALPMRRIGLIHGPFNPPRSAARFPLTSSFWVQGLSYGTEQHGLCHLLLTAQHAGV